MGGKESKKVLPLMPSVYRPQQHHGNLYPRHVVAVVEIPLLRLHIADMFGLVLYRLTGRYLTCPFFSFRASCTATSSRFFSSE